jgi:glycosyltransferase involved in cell wall biosynthesis
VFPRPNLLRPVSEFAWDAAQIMAQARGLDLEVLMPVPLAAARGIQRFARELRGAPPIPEGWEAVLEKLEPRPTLVPYLPLPRRSVESAAAAVSAALLRRRRAQRPALIHGSFLDEGGYAAALAAQAIGAASVVVAHGTDVRMARRVSSADPGRTRRALSALRSADEVVAVSLELASELALCGRRATVIPFTARPERFVAAEIPSGSPLVLFVGRLSRAKGLDLLLEAMARIDRKDARLRLIGPDTKEIDLQAEISRLSLEGRVEWTGELSQADLQAHYHQASCLVLPSRSEGFSCVLVEALLSGRPVIATRVGAAAELIDGHNGSLVSPEDPAALAAAIDQLIADRDRGVFRAEQLRHSGEAFSWKAAGPRLLELTFRLLEARS